VERLVEPVVRRSASNCSALTELPEEASVAM
jgi:hypothetical protein